MTETTTNTATQEPNRKTREYLRYEFTQEELLQLSQDLARAGREKRALEMQKAQVTKQLAGDIAMKDAELERIGNLVFERAEYRNIDCGIYYDMPRKAMAQIIRFDTGEIVKERKMTEDELQLQLDLAKKEGDDESQPA